MYKLKISEVLMVSQKLVLTAFRYPNLSELMGQRKEEISLHHQDYNHRPLSFQSSATLGVHQRGMDTFSFSTYIILLLLIAFQYNRMDR